MNSARTGPARIGVDSTDSELAVGKVLHWTRSRFMPLGSKRSKNSPVPQTLKDWVRECKAELPTDGYTKEWRTRRQRHARTKPGSQPTQNRCTLAACAQLKVGYSDFNRAEPVSKKWLASQQKFCPWSL